MEATWQNAEAGDTIGKEKQRHTPGPWVFAYGSVYRSDTLHDESSIRIALMDRNEPHTVPVERDANARLIAAAPELLEACKGLLWAVKGTHIEKEGEYSEHIEAAQAAIRKAEAL